MLKYFAFSAFLIASPFQAAYPQQNGPVCVGPEYETLDFWIGKWDVTWDGGSGTNEVTREYNGCVIRENFKGSNLKGMSISSYVKRAGTWRQIWVDEQNGFIDLYGRKEGNNYIFHTIPDTSKPDIQLQMIFSGITQNSFQWTWQHTNDGGKNWQDLWQINYNRAKPVT